MTDARRVFQMAALLLLGFGTVDSEVRAKQAFKQTAEVTVDQDGTVHLPAYALPLSVYMSDEAKRAYIRSRLSPPAPLPAGASIADIRAAVEHTNAPLLKKARAQYPVSVSEQRLGGVEVDVVSPDRIPVKQPDRVLISLHGGSFMTGAGMSALLEAIPIASVGNIKVISVDYREAPEFRYPAANDDVISVYRALLKEFKPSNIGIYGCSSGADLTAMTVSRLIKERLPLPGAIGLFCLSAEPTLGGNHVIAGDSSFTTVPLIQGLTVPPPKPNPPSLFAPNLYLAKANPRDPILAPALYPEILAKFPPTLLITGTRDIAFSSTVQMHVLLTRAGVRAELHLWDGMWHSFLTDVSLPESKDAYQVIAKFFERHLGSRPSKQ